MKYMLLLLSILNIFGCSSNKSENIKIEEVYIPTKTEVKIIECDTIHYHYKIDKLLNSEYKDNQSEIQKDLWKLINELYGCIDRQTNEIRSKQ